MLWVHEQKNKLMRKHWTLLMEDVDLKEVLTAYPTVTYRRGPNLRDKLVHNHMGKTSTQTSETWLTNKVVSSHKCGHCKCADTCPQFRNSQTWEFTTGKNIKFISS